MNGLYFTHINSYNIYTDKPIDNYAFVIATNFFEAVQKVSNDFEEININSIKVECIVPSGSINVNAIYVPNDEHIIQKIKDENSY